MFDLFLTLPSLEPLGITSQKTSKNYQQSDKIQLSNDKIPESNISIINPLSSSHSIWNNIPLSITLTLSNNTIF